MHYCGLPKEDMDFLYADGPVMEKILLKGGVRNTLFTGSSKVGEHLAKALHGRIRLEDGGYDWKVPGPWPRPISGLTMHFSTETVHQLTSETLVEVNQAIL